MCLQGCRFQLSLLLAANVSCTTVVPAGWQCLHSGLSAVEQWATATGSDKHTHIPTHTYTMTDHGNVLQLHYLFLY